MSINCLELWASQNFFAVIPAKAGIQFNQYMDSRFRGNAKII